MKNYSIWLENSETKDCPKIDKDLKVDVLIVGGGITGLSTLYQLKKRKINAILVERNICGHGVTARSTAKITYLQEKIYMNIREYNCLETAKAYLESQIEAVKLLKKIIEKEQIACDLKETPSYLFTSENEGIIKLQEEYNFLKACNVKAELTNKLPKEKKIKLALKVNNTYTFHPLKYINHLKTKFYNNIYENSKLEKIDKDSDGYIGYVNGYKVKAKYVVIATHYPYFLLPFILPMKSYIETSYIGAKKITDSESVSAINIDKPTISFRNYNSNKDNYLIYLYNSFKSANITSIKENFDNLKCLDKFQYIWSNKDIITNDYMPFIGRLKVNDNSFLIATGYNTWGMTNATLASSIIADIIQNKPNKYEDIFAPHRSLNLSKIVRFPLDLTANIKAIVKSTKNNINNTNVTYTKIDDKDVAIYKDSSGKEYIVLNKCPHLKCGLVLNEVEKTWDCLCHGSRFTLEGKCIEGPSNYDITYKK